MALYQTWVQRLVPDQVWGRVFTWLDVVWNVMKVLSLGLGGWLAQQAGIQAVYYLGGVLLAFAGLYGVFTLRTVNVPPP